MTASLPSFNASSATFISEREPSVLLVRGVHRKACDFRLSKGNVCLFLLGSLLYLSLHSEGLYDIPPLTLRHFYAAWPFLTLLTLLGLPTAPPVSLSHVLFLLRLQLSVLCIKEARLFWG